MSSFFSSINQFKIVPEDNRIDTEDFLETCQQCVSMFDMLGKGFKPLKSDMYGNIEELEKKYRTNPMKYATLTELIPDDEYEGKNAGLSALWLKRALEFISVFLREVSRDYRSNTHSKSIVPMATVAYEQTLKPYHGWFTQKAFTFITQFAPYTATFFKNFAKGQENMEEQTIRDIETYESLLTQNVNTMDKLIKSLGFDNDDQV